MINDNLCILTLVIISIYFSMLATFQELPLRQCHGTTYKAILLLETICIYMNMNMYILVTLLFASI